MKLKIWVDVDNSPHVLFFSPIIEELRNRGHSIFVTARDYAQTLQLLEQFSIDYTLIGHHYGKNISSKLFGLGVRTGQLLSFAQGKRFSVAVSHGSRSLMLAAGILRIPLVSMFDYEHSKGSFLYRFPKLYLIPEAIKDKDLPSNIKPTRVINYPGTKENVYLSRFRDTTNLFDKMGLDTSKVIALIRPPATDAHYHNEESETILSEIFKRISSSDDVRAVVLPRTTEQLRCTQDLIQDSFKCSNILVLNEVFDGPSLVWSADLVISGGGTMSREAAALGVPAYSIFRGKTAAVDTYLVNQGRLKLIQGVQDVGKIELKKRLRSNEVVEDKALTKFIADHIIASARVT